jgi:hypothetical protein
MKWNVRELGNLRKARGSDSVDLEFPATVTNGEVEFSGIAVMPIESVGPLRARAEEESTDLNGVARKFLERVLRIDHPMSNGWSIQLSEIAYAYHVVGR